METLQINKDNALTAYEEANQKGKKLLENLFGKNIFQRNVIDRIQTFDDVLELNGITQKEFESSCKGLPADEVAYRQIKLIVKAYNEGWVPNWLDSNEYKYYPWFKAAAVGSGVGFSAYDSYYDYSISYVGSRLVYKSKDLAIDAGKKFEAIYNSFLKP